MKSKNLFKRIKQEIEGIPLIDLHTHIRIENPNARNLAEILFYHFVSLEFISSGVNVTEGLPTFAHPLPKDEETIEKALIKYIPFLKNLENTSTYQCLVNIFKDLYEFDLRGITLQNYKVLYDKIVKTSNDDNWTREVLQKRCKVETLVSTNFEDTPESKWIEASLFSPSPERGFLDPIKEDLLKPNFRRSPVHKHSLPTERHFSKSKCVTDTFSSSSVGEPDENWRSAEVGLKGKSLEESLDNLFDEYLSYGVLSVTGGLPADFYLYEPGQEKENSLLKKWLKAEELSLEEDSHLTNLVANKVFKALNKRGMSWVIAVGTVVPPPFSADFPGQTILQINHSLIPNICKVLHSYPKVKLLVLLNSLALSQELCIATRMIPNIYPLGIQWHNFYPVYIERIIRERLETLPMNRNIGFISDAYSTEWFYGKLSIFREALAKVLTEKIEERVYSEKLALRIAKRWLYNNPKEIYFF